jgi:hypothetical protein
MISMHALMGQPHGVAAPTTKELTQMFRVHRSCDKPQPHGSTTLTFRQKGRHLISAIAGTALLVCTPHSSAQSAAGKLCQADVFRQFDFWVGEWDVRDRAGKLAGRNIITLEENGCVLLERWKSVNGSTGMSMNHYDPHARVWRQHWVGVGVVLEMSGGLKDGAIVLEGPMQYLNDNRLTVLRGTWTLLPDGRVRQQFVESVDDGKTWTEWFDGYYSRTSASKR